MLTRANPLAERPPASTTSSMAVAGHPLHPMLVNFPIAFLFAGLPSDLAYVWTGDPFWARASLWLVGTGFAMGSLAAIFGTLDFLLVADVRKHASSWTHFLLGVCLLAIACANWWMRLPDAAAVILPWGVFMSCLTAAAVAAAGWMGGKLVFEHNIGTAE